MKTGTGKVKFKGLNLVIHYEYDKGYPGTWETPPEEDEFYIYIVEVEGVDITPLLTDDIIVEIEEEFLEQNQE